MADFNPAEDVPLDDFTDPNFDQDDQWDYGDTSFVDEDTGDSISREEANERGLLLPDVPNLETEIRDAENKIARESFYQCNM